MKCTAVMCPSCNKVTPIPPATTDYYEYEEVMGEVSGNFHCINCGNIFSVTCTLKIEDVYVFKVAECLNE